MAVKILGILNLATDSFSGDGLSDPVDAIAHARQLIAAGAEAVDIGPSPSNPDAVITPAEIEIQRLAPVMSALRAEGVAISVDTFHRQTQHYAITQGADYLNDVHGFPYTEFYPELAAAKCHLIVMHNVHGNGATREIVIDPHSILERIKRFFDQRVNALLRAGIAEARLILDPGMGFFLSSDPAASLRVLQNLPLLRSQFNLPMLIGVSRKSFVRKLTGRSAEEAGYGTLATELFLARQEMNWIRTHDVRALSDGLKMQQLCTGDLNFE